jgi:hypothetical protein
VNKLRAAIIIIAGSALAAGMGMLPAQAATIHAVSPAATTGKCGPFPCPNDGPYYWEADAGDGYYMDAPPEVSGLVTTEITAIEWEATDCERLPNPLTGTDGTFCKQQDQADTSLCLSSYGAGEAGQIRLEGCALSGAGPQNAEYWWYSGGGSDDSMGGLVNYGTSITYGITAIAVCNGNAADAVKVGVPSGYPNNYWFLIPA